MSTTTAQPESDPRKPRLLSSSDGVTVMEDEVHTRAADVVPSSLDEAAGTFEVVASTGAMVRRGGLFADYDEEIVVSEQVFDLTRFVTVK